MPILSVALCTYNGEKYLDQQLNSILNQSIAIDEVIICDDSSSDNTIEIVKGFQNKFPSIIKLYINTVSLGPVKNFEKALGLCTGEIIFLSDHDDIWKKNKVEHIIEMFEKSPFIEAVFSDGEFIDQNNALTGKTLWNTFKFDSELQKYWSSGNALTEIIYRNKITGATLAIKKSLFNRAVPFLLLPSVWHDAWLGIHAAANKTLGWINEPLIQYRIHADQQVGIGNGITLSSGGIKKSSKEKLSDEKSFYSNCISMINQIADQYPDIDKKVLQKEALDKLLWINYRINLPKNVFFRLFKILNNIKYYWINSNLPIRTIIKDILIVR